MCSQACVSQFVNLVATLVALLPAQDIDDVDQRVLLWADEFEYHAFDSVSGAKNYGDPMVAVYLSP
jgi:hypothetical protein